MYVATLSVDLWDGPIDRGSEYHHPHLMDIENAIRSLDGRRRTLVVLGAEGAAHMAIGGDGRRCVVYATFDNVNFYNLVAPESGSGMVQLIVGGQEGEYSARHVVDIETAVRAARTFAQVGALDEAYRWDEQ